MDFKGVGSKKAMHDGIFKEKIEWNKCEKVDFLQIWHLLIAERGKASSERCTKQGTYCIIKTLSCNRWTAIWLRQQQKWPVKQNLFRPLLDYFNFFQGFVHYIWDTPNSKKFSEVQTDPVTFMRWKKTSLPHAFVFF